MPAYLVSIVEVKQLELYVEYAKAANQAAAKHGGKFLLRGAPTKVLEGTFTGNRVVVSEWENVDKARAYYTHRNTRRQRPSERVTLLRPRSYCSKEARFIGFAELFQIRGFDPAERRHCGRERLS